MPAIDLERAKSLLHQLVGGKLSTIESDEFHVRLIFENDTDFQTQSPWRLIHRDEMLMGHGDVGGLGTISSKVLQSIQGLKLISSAVSPNGDTQLVWESDYVIEVFNDSVQYEIWEAHHETGWVIFTMGGITVFPRTERLTTPPE